MARPLRLVHRDPFSGSEDTMASVERGAVKRDGERRRAYDQIGGRPAFLRPPRRNDRQQKVRVELPTRVNGVRPGPRAIPRVVVLEEASRIVLGADLENEALAALDHDAGRPDLDLERDDRAGL
jgi:hypothetical protein